MFVGALFVVMTGATKVAVVGKRAVMSKYIACEKNVAQRKFFSQANSTWGVFLFMTLLSQRVILMFPLCLFHSRAPSFKPEPGDQALRM